MLRLLIVLEFLCLWMLPLASGQSVMPKLYPGIHKRFSLENGLLNDCVDWSGIDKEGRMWIAPCGYAQSLLRVPIYQYSGYGSKAVLFARDKALFKSHFIELIGISDNDELYGFDRNQGVFFVYDTRLDAIAEYEIPVYISDSRQIAARNFGETFIVSCITADSLYIYEVVDDKLKPRKVIPTRHTYQFSAPEFAGSHLWIWEYADEILRLDLSTWEVKTYVVRELANHVDTRDIKNVMIVEQPNSIILTFERNGRIESWHIDYLNGLVRPDSILQSIEYHNLRNGSSVTGPIGYKDDVGNVLFAYSTEYAESKWLLITRDGRRFDYSDIVTAGLANVVTFNRLGGPDFERILYVYGQNFTQIEVVPDNAIQAFRTESGTRGINQLSDSELFVRVSIERGYSVTLGDGSITRSIGNQCIEAGGDSDVIEDASGRVWTVYEGRLKCYTPQTASCETYDVQREFRRFDFVNSEEIVFIEPKNYNEHLLWFYNLNTKSSEIFTQNAKPFVFEQKVNHILVARDGRIWIATNNGLWVVDAQRQSCQLVEGLSDHRILTLFEGRDDMLWIGTLIAGVQILDIITGEVKIIDAGKGLTNNTVAAMLEDNAGNIWVSTFDGITVLTNSGQVITRLGRQDGLAHKESNRWSALRMRDGRLVFGSLKGVTVIDPARFLAMRQSQFSRESLFITSLSYSTSDEDSIVYLETPVDFTKTITLEAADRSLNIVYAMSDYFSVKDNNFAYQLEGHDNDWYYVGGLNNLTLNNLPAGRYSLLLKGADHRGRWIEHPVEIKLNVKEYFYKTWWFYTICGVLVMFAFGAWRVRERMDRKRLEDEVRRRTLTIRQQSEELKRLIQMKSRLYTNITHEFRTPLTVISGMAVSLKGNDNAKELIRRNSAQLLDLVNQMLDLRKLESGSLPLNLIQGDIVWFLQYLSESFRSLCETKDIQFHFLADEAKLVMDYDRDMITRILSNLLSNAVKFTPGGGNIYVQIDKISTGQKQALSLKVKDTGIGIPDDKLPMIFERFYQVDDRSTRKGEGTGIGLTLVAELVKAMHGEIKVVSTPAVGTTFAVAIPIQNQAEEVDVMTVMGSEPFVAIVPMLPAEPSLLQDRGDVDQNLQTALIVEDNADVLHYLIMSLENDYKVLLAMDGQEGINKALDTIPDIIVSDVMMPVKDGLELCDALKDDHRTSHIPIILLTAMADLQSRLEGIRRGADAYLAKPFDTNELKVQMKALIASRKNLHKRYGKLKAVVESDDIDLKVEDVFVKRFRKAVEDNLDDEDYGVQELCDELKISRAQLHRKMTAITGKSTTQFIKMIRLHQAKHLILQAKLNISQIAFAVGFRDPSYFTKLFQEEFGVLPSQYKEKEV